MKRAIFTDCYDTPWVIIITYGDTMRVMKHTGIDLCSVAETGDFKPVTDSISKLCQVVYWLIYPTILEHLEGQNVEPMQWFFDRIDGDSILGMSHALLEAIVNFTPSRVVKEAIITAQGLRKKAEIVATIQMLAGQLENCTDFLES